MVCILKWIALEQGLKHRKTISQENKKLICESQEHWHNLVERLIDIINFLASHKLAFSGHKESLKMVDRS